MLQSADVTAVRCTPYPRMSGPGEEGADGGCEPDILREGGTKKIEGWSSG